MKKTSFERECAILEAHRPHISFVHLQGRASFRLEHPWRLVDQACSAIERHLRRQPGVPLSLHIGPRRRRRCHLTIGWFHDFPGREATPKPDWARGVSTAPNGPFFAFVFCSPKESEFRKETGERHAIRRLVFGKTAHILTGDHAHSRYEYEPTGDAKANIVHVFNRLADAGKLPREFKTWRLAQCAKTGEIRVACSGQSGQHLGEKLPTAKPLPVHLDIG